VPKGVGYPPGNEYKGSTMHKKEPKPTHTGGGDSWGSPAGRGTTRSHNSPSPSDYSKRGKKVPHGVAQKMPGGPMNPMSSDTMPHKKTRGLK